MSGSWDVGKRVAGAAALTVERVNADKDLLPGRRLEYSWADSGCSAQQGLAAMGKLLRGAHRIDAVIGPGCSSACEVTSYLSGGQGIPQISWGCEAPELSSRAFFVRTVAPVTSKGPALIAFMKHNKWKRAVMLGSTESLWLDSVLGLQKQFKTAGIEVLRPAAFEPGDIKATTMQEIRRSGFRIVLILSCDADAQIVASVARQEGMTYRWGWLRPWAAAWSADMHGWLHIAQLLPLKEMQAFAKQVSDYSKLHFKFTSSPDSVDLAYSAALYDAVMLYAYSATRVMSEGGDLQNGEAVTAAVRNTTIEGVGGTVVALDSNGDRIESYEVMNYVLEADSAVSGGSARTVPVGVYNSTTKQYRKYKQTIVWPGSTTVAPADYVSGCFFWPVPICCLLRTSLW